MNGTGSSLVRARRTRARLESLIDRIRGSANPLEPSLLAELRAFLDAEGLPAALEYERLVDDSAPGPWHSARDARG